MESDTYEGLSEAEVTDWNEHNDHADGADTEDPDHGGGMTVDELSADDVLADLAYLACGESGALTYSAQVVDDEQGAGRVLQLTAIDERGARRTFTLDLRPLAEPGAQR